MCRFEPDSWSGVVQFIEFFTRLQNSWPTTSALTLLTFGFAAGWCVAWLVLLERLSHHRDLINSYKDALANKLPHSFPLDRRRNNAMAIGLGIIIVGLIVAGLGAIVIYNASAAQQIANEEPPSIRKEKESKKVQLQQFYMEGRELANRSLPKDMSPEDFKKYSDEGNVWLNKVVAWVQQNMGDAAKARLLDTSGMMTFAYGGAINEEHSRIINGLNNYCKNLQTLIVEFDAWNKST
jgi:hypothetical protein